MFRKDYPESTLNHKNLFHPITYFSNKLQKLLIVKDLEYNINFRLVSCKRAEIPKSFHSKYKIITSKRSGVAHLVARWESNRKVFETLVWLSMRKRVAMSLENNLMAHFLS